jgi:cellulose synthase/poly-beta-1,6-N-acetylglucosamine synthase-like glycosyltransferase
MNKIAILIPCYNESLTIKKVIEDYREALHYRTRCEKELFSYRYIGKYNFRYQVGH